MEETMELSNQQVLNAVPVLQELVKEKVPIKVSFKLLTVVEKLEDIIRIFNTTKQNLVAAHTKRDEEGNPIPFVDEEGKPDPNRLLIDRPQEFQESLLELQSATSEVDVDQIHIDELGDINIQTEALMQIKWLIKTD
jgi:hypothetical protein